MMLRTFQFLPFLLLSVTVFAQSKQVLFIGNSYTGVNNLPVLTKDLALSLQDTLIIDANTPGGTTFNSHTNNSTSLSKIGLGTWDYVILQAQSQEPSFPPAQVASQTYPYAAILVDSILSANECTVPLFYMTWGRENGDAGNCASYPVICTYDGMQSRLRDSYLEMALDNQGEVSPVGAAWKYVRDNHPTIDLYSADESHPSAAGSYLAACVHYASIYKKSPIGATYTFSLNASDAAILQNAAKLIVIDSLANWDFGPAGAESIFSSSNISGMEYGFTNQSNNTNQYFWDFGDGSTSILASPNHTYSMDGTYTVTLISSNNCDADTSTSSITINSSDIVTEVGNNFTIRNNSTDWTVLSTSNQKFNLDLYSLQGQLIGSYSMVDNSLTVIKPNSKGIYILSIHADGSLGKTIKKVIVD